MLIHTLGGCYAVSNTKSQPTIALLPYSIRQAARENKMLRKFLSLITQGTVEIVF